MMHLWGGVQAEGWVKQNDCSCTTGRHPKCIQMKKKLNKLNLKSTLNVAVHHTPVTELILSVSKVKVTTCTTPYWPYYNHNRNKIQQVSSSCHEVKTDPSKQSNPQQTYNVRVSTVRFTINNQISVLCFNQLWNILRELTPLLPKNNGKLLI